MTAAELTILKTDPIARFRFFLKRPLMFIRTLNQNEVIAFVGGFEWGGETVITSGIKTHLEDKYQITGSNQGWPRQIEIYSKRKRITWFEAFQEVALIVLPDPLSIHSEFPFTVMVFKTGTQY